MKRKEEDFPQNRRNSSASCHALIGLIFQVAMMTRQNGSPYMGTPFHRSSVVGDPNSNRPVNGDREASPHRRP